MPPTFAFIPICGSHVGKISPLPAGFSISHIGVWHQGFPGNDPAGFLPAQPSLPVPSARAILLPVCTTPACMVGCWESAQLLCLLSSHPGLPAAHTPLKHYFTPFLNTKQGHLSSPAPHYTPRKKDYLLIYVLVVWITPNEPPPLFFSPCNPSTLSPSITPPPLQGGYLFI